jgi:hypothetical protein
MEILHNEKLPNKQISGRAVGRKLQCTSDEETKKRSEVLVEIDHFKDREMEG